MAAAGVTITQTPFFRTQRRDLWWAQWFAYFAGLGFLLIVYPTWALLQGSDYRLGNYLSPFYSPELYGSAHAWISAGRPSWWPLMIPFSAALLIMWAPAGFRLTCYYYRGAYYKAFFLDPPNCTVGEARHGYWGENFWPLLIQNAHRYFMYIAVVFLFFLARDVWEALWFTNPATGRIVFGIGVGSVILAINVILIAGYTLAAEPDRRQPRPLLRCGAAGEVLGVRHGLQRPAHELGLGQPDLGFIHRSLHPLMRDGRGPRF